MMPRVAPHTFPKIFLSIVEQLHDMGAVNRETPLPEFVDIDFFTEEELQAIDDALSELSTDEFETLCIGEATEAEAIAARSPALTRADQIMLYVFDGTKP